MRNLSRIILLLALLACLLAACGMSPRDTCRRACQELDLDFYSYSPATFDGGHTEITPPSCCCQTADGELAELW